MSKRDSKEYDLESAFSKAAKRLETKLMLLEFLNNKQVSELAKVKSSLNIYSETFPSLRLYDDEVPINDDILNNFTERIHELPVQMSFESNNSSKCNTNDSFSVFNMLVSKLNVPTLASQQAEKHQKKGNEHIHSNAHVTTSSTQRNNTTRKGIESTETSLELTSATGTAMSLASEANTSKQKQKSPNNSPTRSPTRSLNRSPNNKKGSNVVDLTLKSKQRRTTNGMQTSEIHLHNKSQQRFPVSEKSNLSEYNSNQKGTLKVQKNSLSPVLEDKIITSGKSSLESNNKNRGKSAHIHGTEDNLREIYSSKGSISPKLNPKKANTQPQKDLFKEKRKKESDLRLSRRSSNHSESHKKFHEFSTPPASFRQTLSNQPSAVKEKDPKKKSTIRATTETREAEFPKQYKERSSSLSKSSKSKQEKASPTSSNQKKNKGAKSLGSSPENKIKKKQAQKKKTLQISEKIHFPGPSQTPSPSFGGGRKITTSANETLGFEEDPIPYVRIDDQPEAILSVPREKEIGFHAEVNQKLGNQEHVNQYRGFNQEKVFSLGREEVVDNMDNLLEELMGDSFEKYREPMYDDSPFVGAKNFEDTFSKLLGDSFGSHNVPQGDATLSSRPLSPTNKSDAEKNDRVKAKRRKENQRAKSENLNAPKNLDGKRKSFVFEDIGKVIEPEIKEQREFNQIIAEDKSSKISSREEGKTDNETKQNIQIKVNHLQEQSQASAASLANDQKHQAKQVERINDQKRQKASQQENDSPDFLNSQSKNGSNSTKELYLSTQQSRSHDVDKQAENLIDRVFANNKIIYPQTEPSECVNHQKFESLERAELVDLVESKGKLRKESIYHSERVFSKRSSAATIESNNQNLLEDIEQGKINKLLDEFAGRSNTERVEEISPRALEPCEQVYTVKADGDAELADQMKNIIIQENSSASKLANQKLDKQRKNNLKTFQRYSSTQLHAKSSNVSLETNSIPLSDYASEPRKNKTKQSQKKSKTAPKKDKSARSSSKISTSSNKPLKKENSKTPEPVKSKKPKQKQPAAIIQVLSPKAWSVHNDSSSCIDINHINNNLERQQEALKQHINNKEGRYLKVPTTGRPEIPILRTDKIRAQNSRSDKLTSVSNRSQKGKALTSEFSLGLISNPEEHLQLQHEDEEEEKKYTQNMEFPEISHIENIESEEQSASWYEEISLGMQRNPFSDIGSETRTQDLSNPKKLFTSEIMKDIEKGIEIEVPAEKNSISEKVNFAALSSMTDRSAACKSEILKGWNSIQMNLDSKLGSYDSLAIRKYSVDGTLLPEKKANAVNLDQYRSLNRSQRSSVKQTEESRSKGYEQALQDSSFENRAPGQIHVDGSKDGAADLVSEAEEGFESAGEEKIIKTPGPLRKQEDQQKISVFAGNSDKIGSSTSNQETDSGMKINIPRPNKLFGDETEKSLENSKNKSSDGKISSAEEYLKDNRQSRQSSVAVEDHEKACVEKEKREIPLSVEGSQKQSGLHRDSGKSNMQLLQTNQNNYLGGDYNSQKLRDAIEQSEQNGGIQRQKNLNIDKNSEILPIFQVNSLAESKETINSSIKADSVRNHDIHTQNPPKMSNQSTASISQTIKISKSTQATPDKVDKQIQTSFTELVDKVPQTSPKIKGSPSETMLRFPLSNNSRQTETQNTNPFSLENLLNRAKAKREHKVGKVQILNQKNSANNQNWNNSQIESKSHQPNNLSDKNKFTYPYSKKAEEVTTSLPLVNSSIPVLTANKLIDNSLTPVSETKILNNEATDPAKSAAKKEDKRPLIVIGRKKNEMSQESSLPVNAAANPNKETLHGNSNSQSTVTTKVSEAIVASNQSNRVSYNQQSKAKSSLERTMAFAREFFKNDPTVKRKLV